MNEKRGIILINEDTGERKEFASINKAASFLETNFFNVQRAALSNTKWHGWRVFESPDAIRERIAMLQEHLKYLEG